MPEFDATTKQKITNLLARKNAGGAIQVYELIKIGWPSPLGTVYYAAMDLESLSPPNTSIDTTPPTAPTASSFTANSWSTATLAWSAATDPSETTISFQPLQMRLIPRDWPRYFAPVTLDASIGDEKIEFTLWDGDGAIGDALYTYGEGLPVELLYWFPQETLLLPIFFGHLRLEDEAEIDRITLTAVNGFRSADALIPRRQHWRECSAIFGGSLPTQAEIDRHFDCKYNRHVGGSEGLLNGSSPFTSCPRKTRQNCIDRLGEGGNNMLSHATISSTVVNNQTKGSRLYSTSSGNETELTEPVRVVLGKRRVYGMPVMAYRRDLNNNNPDRGFFVALYECCEGPIKSISSARVSVGSEEQPVDLSRYAQRLGTRGQGPVDVSLTVHGYSGTAHFRYYYGWVNPAEVSPSDAKGTAIIEGLNNVRVYTTPTTYTEQWTSNRVWHILRMMADTRWGYGIDYARFDLQSWIDAAAWAEQWVSFTDFAGDIWTHKRGECHVELIARKAQQQIEEMCLAGRLSRPFLFNGKIHIVPLRAATTDELNAAPVFTETGDNRNILWEERDGSERSTLTYSRKSDLDLTNRVECQFDDITQDYTAQPAPPVEDVDAQLRAGRVAGDYTRKVNPKKYTLMGVTQVGQAIKLATALLDLGEFDEGGLKNNLRVRFKIWFADALELHPFKIIKIVSSRLTRFGFDYFRIIGIERDSDLTVLITAQAYNHSYMTAFETVVSPPSGDPPSPPPEEPQPCRLVFGDVKYENGTLLIPIPPC